MWEVEYTNEFGGWWEALSEAEQDSVDRAVRLLMRGGPGLGRPWVDTIKGSRHQRMKELRVQHRGEPYRVIFAFDPRRSAILLIGGNKTGDKRWYDRVVTLADDLYDRHLRELQDEGLL